MDLSKTMSEKFAASARLPNEWHKSTMDNIQAAVMLQKSAEQQLRMSVSSHMQTRTENVGQYQNVHTNFNQKVQTTSALKGLLQERITSVEKSIEASKQSLGALQHASQAKLAPLQLCTWRQEQRSGRPERELIRDPVEIALEDEKDTLMDARSKLQDKCDETQKMIKSLIKVHQELSSDHTNKDHSLSLDKKCLSMTHSGWPTAKGGEGPASPSARSPKSSTLKFSGSMTMTQLSITGGNDPSSVTHNHTQEESRQQVTLALIGKARDLERAALSLREGSEELIQKTQADSNFALNQVETCLAKRIQESQEAKSNLEVCITETSKSIATMMHCNSMTQDNMQSHQEPADLHSTRTSLRGKRMPRENIGDPVKTALDKHAQGLMQNHNHLMDRHNAEAANLQQLQQAKSACEADLKDKTAALQIDIKCKHKTAFASKLSFDAASPMHTKYPR
jgi:hypothetical protein